MALTTNLNKHNQSVESNMYNDNRHNLDTKRSNNTTIHWNKIIDYIKTKPHNTQTMNYILSNGDYSSLNNTYTHDNGKS